MAEENEWLRRFRQLKAAQEAKLAGAPTAQPSAEVAETAPAAPSALADPEVRWRYEAMLPQVPPWPQSIKCFLLARPELEGRWRELGRDRCHSCGEPLPEGHIAGIVPRCPPCQRATELAVNVRREGVRGPAP